MKRMLGGWVMLAFVATVAASCSSSQGPLFGNGNDDGGSGDGTTAGCGGQGEACCSGTACNAGLTCTGGTCLGSSSGDGGGGHDSGSGGMDSSVSGNDSGSGADTGSAADTGSSTDSGSGGDTGTVVDSGSQDAGSDSGEGGIVVPCPTGLQCNVHCSDGGTTSITGTVYDPAGKNPLYNVAVYVPATPLVALPKGVPTGLQACSCSALFPSGAITTTTTQADGTFVLTNAPTGASVPLVIQVGKWRRQFQIPVTACQNNAQASKSLTLPSSVAAGDVIDNMPDIAVSTGGADTLECLMRRIGLPTTEYVAGAGTSGHVHVFSGGDPSAFPTGSWGVPESPAMTGAPVSTTSLWDSQAHLMPYDIVLLSCEGGETYSANPPVLEAYLNAGGRVFASHYHYAWFSGPLASGQSYTAPADWGSNLATWANDLGPDPTEIGGVIDTTLNGTAQPFPKGVALETWLALVNALGKNGEPAAELSIYSPRFNATVGASNTPSQAWITADTASGHAGTTMYFSFDTPANAPAPPDGGIPSYCGRAVYSDLHVAGDPSTTDTPPPPGGCSTADLSPQEKALEFMIFDLSSCVIPDTIAPGLGLPRR